jgi:Family of unknown function (DUF6171)
MNHEHCVRCPIKAGEYCRGEHVHRLCELIDPATPEYDPGFIGVIQKSSAEWVVRMNGGDVVDEFPSIVVQGKNVLDAARKAVTAWLKGETVGVDADEMARRLSICLVCDHWSGSRCKACGCVGKFKAKLRTEHCPLPEPKW